MELTPTQAAQILGISRSRVLQLNKEGKLPATRTPLGRLFTRSAVAKLKAERDGSSLVNELREFVINGKRYREVITSNKRPGVVPKVVPQILRALDESTESLSVPDLAERTGFTESAVRTKLHSLAAAGSVVRTGTTPAVSKHGSGRPRHLYRLTR